MVLPVKSIIFLCESAVEQLTAEWDLMHLKYVRPFD